MVGRQAPQARRPDEGGAVLLGVDVERRQEHSQPVGQIGVAPANVRGGDDVDRHGRVGDRPRLRAAADDDDLLVELRRRWRRRIALCGMAARRIRLLPVIRFAVPGLPGRWRLLGLPLLCRRRSLAPQDQTQQEQRLQPKKSHGVTPVTTTTHRISLRVHAALAITFPRRRVRLAVGADPGALADESVRSATAEMRPGVTIPLVATNIARRAGGRLHGNWTGSDLVPSQVLVALHSVCNHIDDSSPGSSLGRSAALRFGEPVYDCRRSGTPILFARKKPRTLHRSRGHAAFTTDCIEVSPCVSRCFSLRSSCSPP